MDTSASHTWNSLTIILGHILHCYLDDLSWDLLAAGYLSSFEGRSDVRMLICPRLHFQTIWASLVGTEGEGGNSPSNEGYGARSPEMVPEQQWTFLAEVRKDMWWRVETDKPRPQQRGQELFTWPVLGRHPDSGRGIEVLFKLTSISASSCHFQSREIRINWTAARQALESHKWFVRAFLLGGHNEHERV